MRINRLLLLMFSILFLFNACEKDEYFDIDKDTLFLFNVNDTIIFQNNIANDTFYISDIYHYYFVMDKKLHYEHVEIDFKQINDSIEESNTIGRTYNQVYIYWINFYKNLYYDSAEPNLYTINSRTFEKVYLIENNEAESGTSDVKKIYYTDLYGVIAYELANGQTYNIDLNCLP